MEIPQAESTVMREITGIVRWYQAVIATEDKKHRGEHPTDYFNSMYETVRVTEKLAVDEIMESIERWAYLNRAKRG